MRSVTCKCTSSDVQVHFSERLSLPHSPHFRHCGSQVRAQFAERPGIMDGSQKPDYARCVGIVTKAALSEMRKPGALALFLPIATGFVFRFIGSLQVMRSAFLSGCHPLLAQSCCVVSPPQPASSHTLPLSSPLISYEQTQPLLGPSTDLH